MKRDRELNGDLVDIILQELVKEPHHFIFLLRNLVDRTRKELRQGYSGEPSENYLAKLRENQRLYEETLKTALDVYGIPRSDEL